MQFLLDELLLVAIHGDRLFKLFVLLVSLPCFGDYLVVSRVQRGELAPSLVLHIRVCLGRVVPLVFRRQFLVLRIFLFENVASTLVLLFESFAVSCLGSLFNDDVSAEFEAFSLVVIVVLFDGT